MAKTNKMAALILGAATGVAIVKFSSMPKEERKEFCTHLKNKIKLLTSQSQAQKLKQLLIGHWYSQSTEETSFLYIDGRVRIHWPSCQTSNGNL